MVPAFRGQLGIPCDKGNRSSHELTKQSTKKRMHRFGGAVTLAEKEKSKDTALVYYESSIAVRAANLWSTGSVRAILLSRRSARRASCASSVMTRE